MKQVARFLLSALKPLQVLREGSRKKNPEKVWSFAKPGGGVSEGKQKTKPQVWKCVFFSEH